MLEGQWHALRSQLLHLVPLVLVLVLIANILPSRIYAMHLHSRIHMVGVSARVQTLPLQNGLRFVKQDVHMLGIYASI